MTDLQRITVDGADYQIALPNKDTDYIQGKIAKEGVPYELPMLRTMVASLAPGDIVLDIGANVGNHSLYLVAVKDCTVYAFEPNAGLCAALNRSISANGFDSQLFVHAVGVGAKRGKARFNHLDESNLGAQSLAPDDTGSGEIDLVCLDDFEFGQAVKAIKIDVEGMELPVLEGARKLIERDRPALYIECQTEEAFQTIQAWVSRCGYVYWDTFNATPTHLFVDGRAVTDSQRLERLITKSIRDNYRESQQVDRLKRMLDDANAKYRNASEQISTLKLKLEQANEKYRESSEELAQSKERIKRLGDTKEQLQQARNELERRDEQLEEAASKYREQGQRMAGLREKFEQANEKYRVLSDSHASLTGELQRVKDEYRDISETLEQRLEEAKLKHQDVSQSLFDANERINQFETALATRHSHLAATEAQLRQARDELERRDEQLEEAASKYREQGQRMAGLREKFEQANEKYRVLSDSHASLTGELQRVKDEYRDISETLEQRLEEARLKHQDVSQALLDANEHINQLETDKTATNLRLEALENSLKIIEERFTVADQNYRDSSQSNSALKSELQQVRDKYRQVTATQIPALKTRLDAQQQRAMELYRRVEQLNAELGAVKLERAEALRALSRLRSSHTFKAGTYLRAASGSLSDALKLPFRLWRVRNQVKRRTLPLPGASVAVSAGQTAGTLEHMPTKGAPANPMVTGPEPSAGPLAKLAITHSVKTLRVACIMDDFTFGSYQPECDLYQLTPDQWETELQDCQPELLFIESAWRGKDELWGSKVGHTSQELQGIVSWCRHRGIPTVFWNKEDPVHFETFLNTARLFDFVFTTDIDCVHRYKAILEHERVYFLPFACQPKTHNPIEKYPRKDAFCFAGAYYVRYPERTRDLESFVAELPDFRPLEIYDRNYGKNDPNYQFPEAYQAHIVGTLPFDQIDKAYKGYRYAINLNSIKQSQSMFARRVYELLGSNTLTVSNYSRGLRLMFGDLVITSDSGAEVRRRLEELGQDGMIDRIRLAGLRKAMSEHTYGNRLAYVLSKVSGQTLTVPLPSFKVLATARTVEEVQALAAHIERQVGVQASLTIVMRRGLNPAEAEAVLSNNISKVELLPARSLRRKKLSGLAGSADWIAAMTPVDYYGPHYLLDIALATRYSDAQIVGKGAWYEWEQDQCKVQHQDQAYRPTNRLLACRSAIARPIADSIAADRWLTKLDQWLYDHPNQLAIDPYNYCANGMRAPIESIHLAVDDLPINEGMSLGNLLALAESMAPMEDKLEGTPYLDGRELAHLLSGKPFAFHTGHEGVVLEEQASETVTLSRNKVIDACLEGSILEIRSSLPDGKHEYVYAPQDIDCADLSRRVPEAEPGRIPMHLETEPGLNLSLVVLFLDAEKERIGHVIGPSNRNQIITIPDGAAYIRLGLRIYAGGSTRIKRLVLGHLDLEPQDILGQSDVLLLTNHYPSYDDLYRNGFVHSRVRAYQERDVNVDVFRLRAGQHISWHEFHNVDVTTGSQEALRRMLTSGRYRHILVHFLDPDMWAVLQGFIDHVRVTVWLHGAEIHPWYRRKFNIKTPQQEQAAKENSDRRMAFWRELLSDMPANLQLVFVSNHFAEEVMEDLGFRLPEDQYRIIHNPIDTELFTYIPKPPEQRTRILSIRPFASKQYANDLSVKAIRLLSEKPFFNELEIRLIGDGQLFDKTVEPLRGLSNVIIERRFLTQSEIAALHKGYGVFLCPSRWDSQGVSRDEAMSSGLVPITTAVAAIPEFVDDSCGILAPAENAEALVEAIETLYTNPDRFQRLSENAAERVRKQSDTKMITTHEIEILSTIVASKVALQAEFV